MIRTLAVENAAEFFYKGYLTDNSSLKTAAMEFISKNFAEVKKTVGWKDIMKGKNSAKPLEEILEFMTSKM
jgi:hypothetical protein